MMSLHSSKELALLHLTNCMPSCNVKTIKQLSDGKLFLSIIERVFPEINFNLRNEEKKTFHGHEHSKDEDKTMDHDSNMSEKDSQKELSSVVESSKEIESATESIAAQTNFDDMSSKCEVIDVLSVTKSPEKKSISAKDAIASDDKSPPASDDKSHPASDDKSPPVKNVDVKDEDISKRYEFIECFIDEIYNLQSGKLITYKECMAENEFELAKVTLFVVSEVVRHYVRVNDAVIQTLSHLDIKVQQDLEDCFNLFINERSKITETDIKKLLSSPALYKVSPIKSSFVTPKRSCSSKYKRSTSPSSSPLHDNFIDSPLKTYFESPIFTKKDIITKDKEILKTRQNLYEEEIKSNTLQLRVKEQEKQLKKKDKEINTLKTIIKEFQETEKSEDCENCAILQKSLKEKEKQLREVESMEERYGTLANDYEVKLEKYKVEVNKSLTLCKFEAKQAENRCEVLEAELDDIKFEVLKREQDIRNLVEELEEKTKECEITKEKLSAALNEIEKIPEFSIRGESIGGVIEKENEELRQRIKQLELISLSKKSDMIDAMVQCTDNSLDCKVVENSNFSKNELSSISNFCEKSEPVIVDESLKGCPNVCDINKLDSSISQSSRGPTDAVPFILNNLSPVKSDCVGALWQQYNDSMTENESTNAVLILEKCINKVMSSLQKFETEFPKQNDKHIKFTSRANGSNGLVSSPVIKELMEDLKSLKKSLCLSQVVEKTDVKFQNDNVISKSNDVINRNDCNSNTAVNSTCDTCLKKQEELASSVLSSVSQDSAALLEKTKEFDILNENFLTTVASLRLKEKELNACKKKYILEKRENFQNVKILRDLEIKCQKLQLELKDVRKTESGLKKVMNKDRFLFKSQAKEMKEKYSKLVEKYLTLQADIKSLREKNQKLEDDAVSYRTRNEELIFHIRILERQIKELSHRPKLEPEQSTNIKQETRIVPYTQGPLEHYAQVIPKTEPLSPNECEASSLNTDIEENITASALYTKNLQNPFQLHTADEESFLNHSSIAGLSRNYESEDSLNRVQELNRRNTLCMPQFESYVPTKNNEDNAPNRVVELSRRNTLCMPHLRSCYPAEGVPLNPPNKHLSKYVDFETFESALRDSELSNKERAGKKRKVSEMKTEDQSSDVVRTPSTKMKINFKTPQQSLQKLFKLAGRRNRRVDTIKPKPE